MSFRGFIDGLRSEGLIHEIDSPVSKILEAAKISSGLGPLFFKNLGGQLCVMNILGSRALLSRAAGVCESDLVPYLGRIGTKGSVKEINSAEFMENSMKPDLSRLPILTHFAGDGGPYITSGIVVSRLGERLNACVHRLMVTSKDSLAARLVPGRHTHQLYEAAIAAGGELPVGIAIGVDPLVLLAACTRVPPNMEFAYASALRNAPIELVTLDNGVPVPRAEIVLEGYITANRTDEGPFVDITGTMDLIRKEPVIRLTKMMTRESPIYHGLLPAGTEHKMLMGVPYEPLIYNAVSKVARVKNVLLTKGGCCYFHAVIQIEKETEQDAKRAIDAAFSAHGSLKHVLVVDSDIDIYSSSDLEFAFATRMRGDSDIYTFPNVRGSTLDPRSVDGMTTKVGFDATARLDRLWKFKRVNIHNRRT
jgi:UbiD family decarboxylase